MRMPEYMGEKGPSSRGLRPDRDLFFRETISTHRAFLVKLTASPASE